MAGKLKDYLSQVTADVDQTLNISPSAIRDVFDMNQTIHLGDDDSDEVITHSNGVVGFLECGWEIISASEADTIVDMFADPAKGNGRSSSFKLVHSKDANTYCVKFRTPLSRGYMIGEPNVVSTVMFKVLGYI